MNVEELFDWNDFDHPALFADARWPWEPLHILADYLDEHARGVSTQAQVHRAAVVDENVLIGPGAVIGAGAIIDGPSIIGAGAFIGAGLVRESIVGPGALVGACCEVGRSILLPGSRVTHLAGTLDSIIGRGVNVGGGTLTANTKLDGSEVQVVIHGMAVATGLSRLGSLLGDNCQLGAGCTLSPGTLMGRNCLVYAGALLQGTYGSDGPVVVKVKQQQHIRKRRI
jgi:bifunctional UDP-N-acetylglucosamine pyrophosphorylase/glucosamine-1-phosphate N-acetyltransferase